MTKIYITNINDCSEEDYNFLYGYLDEEKKDKINRFKFYNDKKRSLLGYYLRLYTMIYHFQIDINKIQWTNNEYGKPLVLFPEAIHFNVSHSEDFVICAASNYNVGVDIQWIDRNTDLNIAKRFFTEREYHNILKDEDQIDFFYQYWTLKEAYVKYAGLGLSIPLDTFYFDVYKDRINLKLCAGETPTNLFIQTLPIDVNYKCSICCENESCAGADFITIMKLMKVVNFFNGLE